MATAQIRITADTAQAERALGSLNRALGSLAGLVSVGALADQFIKLADASANLQNKLSTVVQQGQSVSGLFDAMANSALKLSAPIEDITELYTTMSMNTRDLGLSQKDVLSMTESLTKGFQMAGLSAGATSGAMIQLGQAFASGRVNGDELRSIIENLPIVTNQLAQNLGVTRGELKKLGSEGKISAMDLANAIRDSGAALDEAYANKLPTIAGLFTNLNTALTVFFQQSEIGTTAVTVFGTAILSAVNSLIEIANSIENITEWFKLFGDIIVLVAEVFLIGKLFKALRFIYTGFASLGQAIQNAGGIVAMISGAFNSLYNTILAVITPVLNVTGVFARLRALFQIFVGNVIPNLVSRFGWLGQTVRVIVTTIFGWLIGIADRIERVWTRGRQLLGMAPPKAPGMDSAKDSAAAYNAELERLRKNLGLSDKALSGMGGPNRTVGVGGGAGGGGGGPTNAQRIAEATAERNKQYQELIKSQRDSLFLTQFEGNELEIQQAILNANNQMVKEIKDSKGKIIGYTRGMTEEETRQLTLLIQQNQQAKARTEITRANTRALEEAGFALRSATMSVEDRAVEEAIFKNRQQYGSAYTAELEAQDRIQQRQIYNLNQQAQVSRVLADLTRQRTELEIAQAASSLYGNTQEGMIKNQQEQMQALDFLRAQGLISEQSYLDQRVLMNQKAQDDILAYEQKIAQTRLQQAGVTNDAIIKAVTDMQANAQMIQQGGVVAAQGALGALTNVMGSMGQTSEKAFKAYKALAIAQALISTYQAAAMAIAFPPGPPISLIYVAGAIAAGIAQVNAIKSQKYSGRAVGGPVASNTPYIVGERGPELFVPGTAGNIVPNNQLNNQAPVTVNFNIVANDTAGFDQLLTQRRGLITQIIRDAQQERGTRIGF